WGCHRTAMADTVRSGFTRHVFYRTVGALQAKGYLERQQGERQEPGPGQGFAIDRLTFETPKRNFVQVDRGLFNGTLTPTEIAVALYILACRGGGAKSWHIAGRFGLSRPTVAKALGRLESHGRIVNRGTKHVPIFIDKRLELRASAADGC